MKLKAPKNFSLFRSAMSHGWIELPPFSWDDETSTLESVLTGASGKPVLARIRQPQASELSISLRHARVGEAQVGEAQAGAGPSTASTKAATARPIPVNRQVRHILRLDEPLNDFYSLCRQIDGFSWIPRLKLGHLLRSPSPFEDLVKLICTTNCSWSFTKLMVRGLVKDLGEPLNLRTRGGSSWYAFPAASRMARATPAYYKNRMKAGYRGPYLRELARRVSSGNLDPAAWLDPSMPGEEIQKEISSVKGAGLYVVENMMKLLGRYDGLGLDSWVRKEFSTLHKGGRPASDAVIARYYKPFGAWRGLAMWCDLTRGWHEKFNS